MGLFGKTVENEKFTEIEQLYRRIDTYDGQNEECVSMIDKFIEKCESLTISEADQFNKIAKKQSKRNRSINSFEHPLYGFFFGDDDLIDKIIQEVQYKKKAAQKAIKARKEFESIEDISPVTNNESVLERQSLADMPEIKIQNITKSFDIDNKLPIFIVLDLETTGLTPSRDRVIQVSAMKYEYFKPTEVFVSYVNPGVHIPEDASRVNGLYDDDVKDAPPLSAIAESLLDFVGKVPIVGFNTSFDLQFLFCSGIDLISKRKIYDAKALAKKLYKRDLDYFSLENVLSYNGISIGNLHNAKVDCYATGMVFLKMLRQIIQ